MGAWEPGNNKWRISVFLKKYVSQNKCPKAKILILIQTKKNGARANWGAFQLFKAHLLAAYEYFAQSTLFWAKINALVMVHQRNKIYMAK